MQLEKGVGDTMGYKRAIIERGVEKNNVQRERDKEIMREKRIQYDIKNTRSGDRATERAWQAIVVVKWEYIYQRWKKKGRKRKRKSRY